jgi:hypothetical protein
VNYREMLRHAAAGNYHVSIATIPLDTWYVHKSAGAIFKDNAERVSLLYHGNDHVSNELAQPLSPAAMHGILLQARSRVVRMEQRTGLRVARVMAAPHGACSELAIAEMARTGFEAACVSRGSLRYHNGNAAWSRSIGMKPCDIIAGLPVIPRFGLSKSCANDVLIAAALHQPIVPFTHHAAVAEGYQLLDETAAFVNALGDVRWTNLGAISRSLYAQRRHGETFSVRMYSKQITVAVPEGMSRLEVNRPWLPGQGSEELSWRPIAGDRRWRTVLDQAVIGVEGGATIEIASGGIERPIHGDAARPRLKPVIRRLLTEARDRVLPSVHRIARALSKREDDQ